MVASKKRSGSWLIILGLVVVVIGAALFALWPRLESDAPKITLSHTPTHLGRDYRLGLTVSDQGQGLRSIRVQVMQGTKTQIVLDKSFEPPDPAKAAAPAQQIIEVAIKARELGFADGPATLIIDARDHSWREWWHGNLTRLEYKVVVDTVPPAVRLLTRNLYINRGGAAMAIYETPTDVIEHGVQVGARSFGGFAPWPDKPKMRICFFAYSQAEKPKAPIKLWAQDPGGNRTEMKLPVGVRWKKFRHDTLRISDGFLDEVLPRFQPVLPQGVTDPVKLFVWINSELRKRNNAAIVKATQQSGNRMMFTQAFSRSAGKTMAGFPDRRVYLYKGKQVSRAVHLGIDLADVTNSPIISAAAGRVAFSGEMGIYGNTIILDHGLGLSTLYGHMSQLLVQAGDQVEQGQKIGISGATGLALGDHLHFSVLVGGVFVHPKEWWDSHWLRDNVLERIKQAGLTPPSPSGGQ